MSYLRILVLALMLSVAVCPVHAQQLFVPNLSHPLFTGQLAWWRGVPGLTGGTTLYDLLPARRHGTLTNMGYSTTSGWNPTDRRGGYVHLAFDVTDDYVDMGSVAVFDDLPQRTVCAWIKPLSYGGSLGARIVDKNSSAGWAFSLDNTGGGTAALAYTQVKNTTNGFWYADNVITLGVWQHVAYTYDASADANDPILYVNGEPLTLSFDSNGSGGQWPDNASPLRIGAQSSSVRQFEGGIDDVRYWNRILSATEIRTVYQQSLRGDPDLFLRLEDVVSAPPVGGILGRRPHIYQ